MTGKPLRKEVRKACDEAKQAGFAEELRRGHTHSWLVCPCGQHVQVFSTGRNPENGAKVIQRFVAKHSRHIH